MDEKYTPLGLPVIFKDVISTSLRDETEYSDSNNFVKQKYDNLRKVLASENPILLDYVNVGLNTAPNEAAAEAFIFGINF